jgi:hypothetical protein
MNDEDRRIRSEDKIRDELRSHKIYLIEESDIFWQVDNAFVKLSRDNETVESIDLCLHSDPDRDASTVWDKVAEGTGNLQALQEITIESLIDEDFDEEDLFLYDWKILACILRRLRRGIYLRMDDRAPPLWDTETLPAFVEAIHGQAMVTGFHTGDGFPFHFLDTLCSALLTLPALEKISFTQLAGEGPEEGQSLESMVQLLQSPILRKVDFTSLNFTNTLCQAVAKALRKWSKITDLGFSGCSFPRNGSAMIARELQTNTTLKCLEIYGGATAIFYEALAAALPFNSTLQELALKLPTLRGVGINSRLVPLFLALQVNTGLKKLTFSGKFLIDEKLSTAMKLGLGNNSTLESLRLLNIKSGGNDTSLWREAFSFLRINTALKCLEMRFEKGMTESDATAFRMETLAALCENESLETLKMASKDARFEDYRVCVDAIKLNTTLKSLRLNTVHFDVDDDETKCLIPILKKNYGLEDFPGLRHGPGDIRSILKLNRAGRRYLVQDGSSISKGVDVLSRVSNDINSLFLHLLENPRLCDRSAIETASIGNIDNARLTSPGNRHSGGKQRESQVPHNLVQGSARIPLSSKDNFA